MIPAGSVLDVPARERVWSHRTGVGSHNMVSRMWLHLNDKGGHDMELEERECFVSKHAEEELSAHRRKENETAGGGVSMVAVNVALSTKRTKTVDGETDFGAH